MADQSSALYQRAKQVAPGGVHSPVRAFKNVDCDPVFIKRGDGVTIEDVDGRSYTDYCLSWGPLLLGHGDEDVKQAVVAAIDNGWTFGTAEAVSLELGELLVEALPWIDKIRFVNSGTEAVMSALRVARGATGKDKVVKFDGCYHGHVDSMLVKAGSGLADMASPDSAGVSKGTAAETIVVPLDNLKAVEQAFQQHAEQIAAIIVEPLPANNGLLLQKDEFLAGLRSICDEHGALLIFDEVITGFRLAFGGAAERFGVYPDLVTYGKIIGGGFPVGAFGGRADLMAHIAPEGPVYQAGTLSANPVAMAAGLATLKKLKATNPYPQLEELTKNLGAELMQHACDADLETVVTAQSCASLFWVALGQVHTEDGVIRRADQIPQEQKATYGRIYPRLLEQGYYLAPSGFEVGFMATGHSAAQNRGLIAAIIAALKEL